MNKRLPIFLLFIIIFFICINKSFSVDAVIKDYTDVASGFNTNNNRLVITNNCLLNYVIRIEKSDSGTVGTGFQNSVSTRTSQLGNGGFIELWKVGFDVSLSTGNITIIPTFSTSPVSFAPLNISYICKKIDASSISFKVLNQGYDKRGFSEYYNTMIEVEGVGKQLLPNGGLYSAFNAIGFAYVNVVGLDSPNLRILSNYMYFSFALYLNKVSMAENRLNNVVNLLNDTISVNITNPIYKYSQNLSPVSLIKEPGGCLSLKYWHCYIFESTSLQDSSKYMFNTFVPGYLGAMNFNFKVQGNGSRVNYLNVLPAYSDQNVNPLNYSLAYYGANRFEITRSFIVSYTSTFNSVAVITPLSTNYNGVQLTFNTEYLGSLYISTKPSQVKRYIGYPFGVKTIIGSNSTASYDFVLPIFKYLNSNNNLSINIGFDLAFREPNVGDTIKGSNTELVDTLPPTLFYYGYDELGTDFSITLGVSDDLSGVASISINLCSVSCIYILSIADLVQGSYMNGYYQIVLPKAKLGIAYASVKLDLIDRSGNQKTYNAYDVYNDVSLDFIPIIPYLKDVTGDPTKIKNITFSQYNITNEAEKKVTMYIQTATKLPNYQFGFTPNFRIVYESLRANNYYRDETDKEVRSVYNPTTELHEIEISIPARLPPGPVSFMISPVQYDHALVYSLFKENAQLNIVSSDGKFDIMPPIVSYVSMPLTVSIPTESEGIKFVRFVFDIVDDINLFDRGVVNIVSNLDFLGWNFTFDSQNNTKPLQLNIPIDSTSIPQTYRIGYIWLVDKQGHVSEYPSETKVSPLMKVDLDLLKVTTTGGDSSKCNVKVLPTLSSFSISGLTPSSNGLTKNLQFNFTTNGDYGISTRHLPIVYLSSSTPEVIGANTKVVRIIDSKTAEYTGSIDIPFSFGYPDGIALSLYGITDLCLNVNGYNTVDLQLHSSGFPYFVNNSIMDGPEIISGVYQQNLLKISGFRFGFKSSTLIIKYETGIVSEFTNFNKFSSQYIESDAVKIRDLDNTIQFAIKTSDGLISPYKTITIPGTNPTPTPTITTAPKTCPGTPECGGSTRGACDMVTLLCKCISPYLGDDCSLTSAGNGTVDPEEPTVNFNYTSDAGVYKSLIVVNSLQELDFNGKVIRDFTFKNWSFVKFDEDHFQFNASVPSFDQTSESTTVIVKIVRYHEYTTINFAKQNITIEPSTVKYSIDMDAYKFQSNLNYLRLLISTSLQTDKTEDICSSSQFGDNGDSSYIKIQIDKTILVGRFLKRAIIDGIIATINQIPISSLEKSNSSNSQSFIAMEIPFYRQQINLDPNFSVLISDNSANENDPNSMCNRNSKVLTTAQIIGIAIGGAFFLVVVVIFVGIVLFRHHSGTRILYYKLFKKGLKRKVNN